MKNRLLFSFMKKYYGQVKYTLFAVLLILPVTALLSQLVPWYVSKIITLINTNVVVYQVWQSLFSMFLIFSALMITGTLLTLAVMYLLQSRVMLPLGISIRRDLFVQALGQHRIFWSRHDAGDVFGKIENSRRTVAAWSSIGDFLLSFYTSVWTLIVMLLLLAKIYVPFAAAYLCGTFVLLGVFHRISVTTFRASAQQENLLNRVFGRLVNMVSNYFVLKMFASAGRERKRLDKDYSVACKAMQKNSWLRNRNQLFLGVAVIGFECSMIAYAVVLWAKGIIQVGDVVYILNTVMPLGGIVSNLAGIWMFNRSQLYKLQNNLMLLDAKPEIEDVAGAGKLKVTKGEIEFRNLTFAYAADKMAVDGFSLKIKGGEKVGIVGMSGGGKTTLLHLLQRLVNTPGQAVFIDGQDITRVTQESLHKAVAFIPQDTSLFHRSLAENVSYGKFNAAKRQIAAAAENAYVEEFATDLPQGYQTLVGDKGVKLSGGQRQRVGIARAILKDCKILLLDEATSALDSKSEKYIQQSLQKLIRNKTVITVAHRLSTLKKMDRIVVMENGRIIEEGTPAELLRQQGKYSKLWNLQA